MEAEEDLFVVIVGNSVKQLPLSNIKLERIDSEISKEIVDNILKQASQFGQFINNEELKLQVNQYVSEESVDEVFYDEESLDHGNEVTMDNDDAVEQDEHIYLLYDESLENNEAISDPHIGRVETVESRSSRKPKVMRSIVAELRDTYPELQDEDRLIDTVKELMKNVKPPPLPIHYCKHVINNEFRCSICDTICVTLVAAGRHYEENHGPHYLTCYACGADFRRKQNLYKHEQECSSPDAIIVSKARDIHLGCYATDRSIAKMCRKKIAQSKLNCPVCYESYPNKFSMQVHTNTVHADILLPYKCSKCPRAFSRPSMLKAHLKSRHTLGDRYICDICCCSFRAKDALIGHIKTHSEPKRYKCDQCPKYYSTKHSLNKHINIKHKQMPPSFVCKTCMKRFYALWQLKNHMKKEHNETLLTQSDFMKKFSSLAEPIPGNANIVTKEELEQLSKETLEDYYLQKRQRELELLKKKRFACSQCDKSYVLKVDLKLHLESMHGDHRPMRCQICHNVYRRLDLLKRHMKNQHQMKLMTPETFQKALPHLTKEQIEEAQIVLKPSTARDKNDSS